MNPDMSVRCGRGANRLVIVVLVGVLGLVVASTRVYPHAWLWGNQLGPLLAPVFPFHHDFPGVHRNGKIDWWW